MTEATPYRSHSPAEAHHHQRRATRGVWVTRTPTAHHRHDTTTTTTTAAATSTTSSNYDAAADVAAAGVSQLSIDFPIPRDQRSSMRAARYFEHKHRLASPASAATASRSTSTQRCAAADTKAAPDSTQLDLRFDSRSSSVFPDNTSSVFSGERFLKVSVYSEKPPHRETSAIILRFSLRIGLSILINFLFPRTRSPT